MLPTYLTCYTNNVSLEIFHVCFDKQIENEIYNNSTTGEK